MIHIVKYRLLLSGIASLLLLLGVSSCTNSKGHQDKISRMGDQQVEERWVEIEKLEMKDFPVELILNGKIISKHQIAIILDQKGYITQLNIYNGKLVRKGDTLAIIENTQQKIQCQKAMLAFKETENELSSLMLGFGGTAYDTNSVESEIFQNLKINSGYTRALLDLKMAQLNYQNTFICAPISGLIAHVEYQKYQYAASGTALCQLVNNDQYLVEFQVTESELAKIHLGQSLKIQAIHDEMNIIGGKIIEINPMVDDNALIKVIAEMKPTSRQLYSGRNARISIEKKIPNSLSIPKKALVLRNNEQVVFTYQNGKAFLNYVETSAENSQSYLISRGLQEGDSIIIDGQLSLAHQVDVQLKQKDD